MSKCLTVVAFVLLVLSGAMGLRKIVATSATGPGLSAPALLAQGGGAPFPPPPPPGGGGH